MSTKLPGEPAATAFADEAESNVRDISASYCAAARTVLAEWIQWLRVPPVSGLECVQALRAAGFRVAAKLPGCVELGRDGTAIQVPLAERLSPDVLIAILLKARVGPTRFLELLDAEKQQAV